MKKSITIDWSNGTIRFFGYSDWTITTIFSIALIALAVVAVVYIISK